MSQSRWFVFIISHKSCWLSAKGNKKNVIIISRQAVEKKFKGSSKYIFIAYRRQFNRVIEEVLPVYAHLTRSDNLKIILDIDVQYCIKSHLHFGIEWQWKCLAGAMFLSIIQNSVMKFIILHVLVYCVKILN